MGNWAVRDDGSFDAMVEGIRLTGCWPSIDGAPVKPVAVTVTRGAAGPVVEYRLLTGSLVLVFAKDEDSLVLRTTLRGMAKAPHWVQPLAAAVVEGAERCFKQGLGFGGPSGFMPIDPRRDPWSLESYAVAGLLTAEDQTLAIGPYDHSRFLFKATLLNRVSRRGLVDRHVERAQTLLECAFSTERIASGAELALPDLHLIASPRPWDALRRLAIRTGRAMKARTQAPPAYHWCSWYRRGGYFSRAELDAQLASLTQIRPAIPLRAVQIDAGYCPSLGDWLEPNALWPGGLQPAFAAIASAGQVPGIWVGPFMVGSRSRIAREHPDWVLKGLDGKPVVEWRNYDNAKPDAWSDEETYALDTTHPEAFAYLRTVFRTLRGWGCRFFKTDFMDWGLKDTLTVRRHTGGKTSVEHYRDVLAMIREEIGEDSYWLGCIAPFAPFIGFADGMRVANDVGHVWQDGGIGNMLAESHADQYFNNVWWQNDPDVVFLRDRFIELDEKEIRALAYWHGILGSSVNTSEYFHELPPERLKLWRFIEPDSQRWTATLPHWSKATRLRVAVREYQGHDAWAVLVLNPSTETATEVVRLADAVGLTEANVFSWEPGRARGLGRLAQLAPELAGHSAQLFYISKRDEPPPPDLSLGGKTLATWVTGSVGR